MKQLTRYIGLTFLKWTFMILFFLTALCSFFNFVAQLQHVGNGTYSVKDAFIYTIQALPAFIYQLFPIVGLLGVLVGLGQLASGSELIIMRASGYSRLQIVLAVFVFAVPLTLFAMFIGEGFAPRWAQEANAWQAIKFNNGRDVAHDGGWLLSDHSGVRSFISVNEKRKPTQLIGVNLFQFDEHSRLQKMSFASELDSEQGRWIAKNVSSTVLHYQGDDLLGTSVETLPTQVWPVDLNVEVLRSDMVSVGNVQTITLPELALQIDSKRKNKLDFSGYELTYWQRIFQPIESLIMIFLAIPFVFGSLRNASMIFRLAVGGGIGFVFYVLNQYAGYLSIVLQMSPIIGAAAPMALFFFIGLVLIRKRF